MKQKLIFVVDDDEMTAYMLKEHLEERPYNQVIIFKTGEDCLKKLNMCPDVIILDYQLNSITPEAADGLHILQQIKRLNKEIQVIMLSSQTEYGKAIQTIMKGAAEYVMKNNDAFKRIDNILRHS